jgi:phosphoenolpyruvate synthase/pyruvate phosphate dikinase
MPVIHAGDAVRSADSGNALVLDLADIDSNALSVVGGKAANLGVLTRARLPVPPGVCVTTDAYRLVAESADLDRVFDALAGTSPTDVARLGALAGEARAAMLAAPVPDSVAQAVVDGYARLGADVAVAVRSSATAEDLPFASFAGQQDTYLNVVGPDAVLDAVRRCWASLWTDRAVAYRATNGIDHRTVWLAVVIQQMVDAAIAGVLFTANPVTGRRRQAVIDASPGLGEAVVSGAVNPDHFVVETASGEIVERRIGDKRVVIRARSGGGTEHVERSAGASEACLTDDQVRALAALGDRVEAHYGRPQDTEWAIDASGAVWLTQARPITTLFPLPVTAPPPGRDLRVYFCFSVAQGLYRPITPMGLAGFRLLASAASEVLGFPVTDKREGPTRYAEAGQRLFADVTGVLRSRAGRAVLPRVLDAMEARSAVVLRQVSEDPRLSLTNRSWVPFARRVLRIAARYKVPVTAVRALARPDAAHRHAERIGADLARELVVPNTATSIERLDFAERILVHHCVSLVPRIGPAAAAGMAMLALSGKLLGDDATADDLQTVLRGLPHNVTTEMDLALWALAGRIRADREAADVLRDGSLDALADRFRAGSLPSVAQRGLVEFLVRYGHRAVAEIDLGMPRWSDDPRHILGVLTNYLRLEGGETAPDAVFARGIAEAEAMIDTLAARAGRRSRLRARLVRFALGRARSLVGLRELPKYNLIVAIAAVRRQLAIVGADLVARGRLETPDDVFFVDLTEARAGLGGQDLRERVAQRREAYDLELRRRHVPRVLLSDGTEPEALTVTAAAPDGSLAGTPASAGRVTGTARVIQDPVGAHLQPGEILIALSTDPGWTPLFLTAGGVVMEMGGANSHGAVVAREYGIPAVVGVPNATIRITTGQRITVDGSAGTVSVV